MRLPWITPRIGHVAFALVIAACWHITYLFRLGFERWQTARPDYDLWVMLGVMEPGADAGLGLVIGGIVTLAGLSWLDDLRNLSAGLRILCHALVVTIVLAWLPENSTVFQGLMPLWADRIATAAFGFHDRILSRTARSGAGRSVGRRVALHHHRRRLVERPRERHAPPGAVHAAAPAGSRRAPLAARDGVPNWEQVAVLIKEWQPQLLLVGLPLNMDDTESELSQRARKFGNRLHGRFNLPVEMFDERLTTRLAKEEARERGHKGDYANLPVGRVKPILVLEGLGGGAGLPRR